jgi:uncharacterized radical SAM superfamily Fe-S cluster-containing enzyme
MSLNSIISDVFNIDIDEIDPEMHLQDELNMDSDSQQELNESIAEYFDGLQIDLGSIGTLSELYEKVVENEFRKRTDNP